MPDALFKQETSSLYTRTLELAPQTLEQLIVTCNSSTEMKSAFGKTFTFPTMLTSIILFNKNKTFLLRLQCINLITNSYEMNKDKIQKLVMRLLIFKSTNFF